jgi:hypothetical protein
MDYIIMSAPSTSEQRLPSVHLYQNTAKRPHVDLLTVGEAKQNLWRSIEPTWGEGDRVTGYMDKITGWFNQTCSECRYRSS